MFIISNIIWCQIFGLDVQWKVTIHPVLQDAKAGLLIKHSSNAQSLLLIARQDIWPRSAGEPTIGVSGEEMVYLCGNQTLAHPMQLWRLRTLSSDLTLQFSATNDPVLRPGNGFDGIFKGTEVDEPLAITASTTTWQLEAPNRAKCCRSSTSLMCSCSNGTWTVKGAWDGRRSCTGYASWASSLQWPGTYGSLLTSISVCRGIMVLRFIPSSSCSMGC